VPGHASLLAFVPAALVVLLLPGPGVLYVVARSVTQGRRAGLASALGLSAGALVHVGAAVVGFSALLLASSSAFGLVKACGAGYLVYLGVRTLLGRDSAVGANASSSRTLYRLFRDGVVVSVFNPKIAVFFLAFLPQFVEPGRGPIPQQVLLLGLLYVVLALCTDSAYAFLASRIRNLLQGRVVRGPLPRYAGGAIYIGLGMSTAFAQRE